MPSGNILKGHMITIGAPAVRAHLKHGDFIGACENNNEGNETVEDNLTDNSSS